MAYVDGFKHDVFLSYAHIDNEPPEKGGQGWVDAFWNTFKQSLYLELGRRETSNVWRDAEQLRANQDVKGHIDGRVGDSALLLLVLSPSYLASEACLRELRAFVQKDAADRIFVAWKHPVKQEAIPAEIRDLKTCKLWYMNEDNKPRTMGWPIPMPKLASHQEFYEKTLDLAREVAGELSRLLAASQGREPVKPQAASAKPQIGSVLLAEVTDDLGPRRDEVSRYLNLEGIAALPSMGYRLARADFEQGFKADLETCKAFVQILGPYAGKAPPDVPEGYCKLQLDLARARGIPILQWRSPELDTKQITDGNHRALVEADGVQAMPVEEFKRSIVEMLAKPIPPPPVETPPFLTIFADPRDIEAAGHLISKLDTSMDYTVPLPDESEGAREVDSEAARNMVEGDAIVFFYGQADARWVQCQINAFRRLSPQRRSDPKVLMLITAPPEPKKPIPIRLRGLAIVPYAEAAEYIQRSLDQVARQGAAPRG